MAARITVNLCPLPHFGGLNLPNFATASSAGVDLEAAVSEPMTLKPGERALVATGLTMALPDGYEAQIRPRSGLAFKNGVTVLNSPGTIDADYRGEIKVILVNLSGEQQTIQPGDRIAQMVVQPVTRVEWEPVAAINETERNAGGFGHTGKA